MGAQGDRIFAAIKERGFPDPWSTFGECMSWEAAYAVQLKAAIEAARKNQNATTHAAVEELFTLKASNLAQARQLLDDVLAEYDRTGMWTELDRRARELDIDDVSERWARGLVEHPFPIALRSLQFNWTYMKNHGVRAFYEMTARYVDDLSTNTARWQKAWTDETASGHLDRVTTVECDLASEEARATSKALNTAETAPSLPAGHGVGPGVLATFCDECEYGAGLCQTATLAGGVQTRAKGLARWHHWHDHRPSSPSGKPLCVQPDLQRSLSTYTTRASGSSAFNPR
jgi:hypothetical protein